MKESKNYPMHAICTIIMQIGFFNLGYGNWAIGLKSRMFTSGPADQGSI